MSYTANVLLSACIRFRPYLYAQGAQPAVAVPGVVLTSAHQLIGTYATLRSFQTTLGKRSYAGWHAHHIVPKDDLIRLGVSARFPPQDQQICVLLPESGHSRRIHSILQNQSPRGATLGASEFRAAYSFAYWLLGDYCEGGEAAIQRELMAIVDALFRHAGLA